MPKRAPKSARLTTPGEPSEVAFQLIAPLDTLTDEKERRTKQFECARAIQRAVEGARNAIHLRAAPNPAEMRKRFYAAGIAARKLRTAIAALGAFGEHMLERNSL